MPEAQTTTSAPSEPIETSGPDPKTAAAAAAAAGAKGENTLIGGAGTETGNTHCTLGSAHRRGVRTGQEEESGARPSTAPPEAPVAHRSAGPPDWALEELRTSAQGVGARSRSTTRVGVSGSKAGPVNWGEGRACAAPLPGATESERGTAGNNGDTASDEREQGRMRGSRWASTTEPMR